MSSPETPATRRRNGVKVPPDLQAYQDDLQAYELRFAAWLGIDPHEVAKLDEVKKPVSNQMYGIPQPPDLQVSWQSYGKQVDADDHLGRYQLPVAMHGYGDGQPPVFTNSMVLDWREVERLRAEVGERPEFPAPAGGWPADWPKP